MLQRKLRGTKESRTLKVRLVCSRSQQHSRISLGALVDTLRHRPHRDSVWVGANSAGRETKSNRRKKAHR
jgi:hypothetical protein